MYGNYNKTHKIKVFENLLLCVFVILKILSKFSTFAKSSLQCFPNQNLSLNGNLCQLAPVNLRLVDVKE